jgi:hypothetical protein
MRRKPATTRCRALRVRAEHAIGRMNGSGFCPIGGAIPAQHSFLDHRRHRQPHGRLLSRPAPRPPAPHDATTPGTDFRNGSIHRTVILSRKPSAPSKSDARVWRIPATWTPCLRIALDVNCYKSRESWCGREDLNLHGISPTATSTLRVYRSATTAGRGPEPAFYQHPLPPARANIRAGPLARRTPSSAQWTTTTRTGHGDKIGAMGRSLVDLFCAPDPTLPTL